MFLRQETAGHVKYVLPRSKNGIKKSSLRWSASSVSVISVRPLYSVCFLSPKLMAFRLLENCTRPISINKCRVCVCVPSDAFHVRMSKMADGKRALWIKQPCNVFFWGGGWEEIMQIHQLIVLFFCFLKVFFLFTFKQLLFYIERQFWHHLQVSLLRTCCPSIEKGNVGLRFTYENII